MKRRKALSNFICSVMKKKLLSIVFIVVTFFACNQDDATNNLPPRDFEVKAISAGINTVSIRWTESTDPENSTIENGGETSGKSSPSSLSLLWIDLSDLALHHLKSIFRNAAHIMFRASRAVCAAFKSSAAYSIV